MIVFATEYKQAFYDKENILDPLKKCQLQTYVFPNLFLYFQK